MRDCVFGVVSSGGVRALALEAVDARGGMVVEAGRWDV